MKNILYTITAGLLIAAISLAGVSCKKQQQAAAPPPPTPEQKAKIEEVKKRAEEAKKVFAAQVNGVDISMQDLLREMNLVAQRYDKGNGNIDKPTAQVKKEALNELVFRELAIQEAVRQGIKVGPERIDAVISQMKTQMGAEAFQQYLDERALTDADLRKLIERSHLFEMITAKEIYGKIKIDEKDMRAEYEKNKSTYKDRSGKQMEYEQAANLIRRKLTAEAGAEKMKEWEKELRKSAKIVIAKEGGK